MNLAMAEFANEHRERYLKEDVHDSFCYQILVLVRPFRVVLQKQKTFSDVDRGLCQRECHQFLEKWISGDGAVYRNGACFGVTSSVRFRSC